jgi:hypothetical protein
MGTTLTGTTPQDTYDSLIKVTDNGPLTGSLKLLTDGLGNNSALSLSTAAASVTGTLAVSGNATFDTNTLFVDATNNRVGILTVTPTEPLHVEGNISLAYGSSLKAANATYQKVIETGYDGSSDFVSLYTAGNNIGNATAKITMLANGSVGIGGTPDSDYKLQLYSATNAEMAFESTGAGGGFYRIGTGHTASGFGGDFRIYDMVATAERMRITSTGVLSLNQGQIQFPATQVASANANTLDDYEEGTWTMGVSFGGASVGVTYASNTGTYTKIGRQVTVNGLIDLSNKGSSINDARITGLPFTIGNSNANFSPPTMLLGNITFANVYSGYGETNSTTILLLEVTALGTTTTLTNADFANNSSIMVSFTYFV